MAEAGSKSDSPLNLNATTSESGNTGSDGSVKKETENVGSVQVGSVTGIMAGIKPEDRGHPERKRRASNDSFDVCHKYSTAIKIYPRSTP